MRGGTSVRESEHPIVPMKQGQQTERPCGGKGVPGYGTVGGNDLMTSLSARAPIGERGGKIARFRKCAFSRSYSHPYWPIHGLPMASCVSFASRNAMGAFT